jgi:transposase
VKKSIPVVLPKGPLQFWRAIIVTIVLRQKWSRGQVEARLAAMPPCPVGMEACVGAHHLSRKLQALAHDARLMQLPCIQ